MPETKSNPLSEPSTARPSLREQVIVYGLFLAGAATILAILFFWG